MRNALTDTVETLPVIGAARNEEGLRAVLESDAGVVFLLYGDICNIGRIVETAKAAHKLVLVHADLINGLASKEIAADFIRQFTGADGIITTKSPLIRRAKELGLYTVQRFFVIDSKACENIPRQLSACRPDMIEVLPGVMPEVIRTLAHTCRVPIIAGGLIQKKEDVVSLLGAGAAAVSASSETIWSLLRE